MKREDILMVSLLTKYEKKGDCHRRGKEKSQIKLQLIL